MTFTQIVNSRSEIGAGKRGASLGVSALKHTAINQNKSYFNDRESIDIIDANHILFQKSTSDYKYARHINHIIEVYKDFCLKLDDIYRAGNLPIVLAGDHSSAGGTIAGIKRAFPKKRLGVIWVDAHADLHSPYTSPSGNVHGMPLAASLGIDNKEHQINNVSEKTLKEWEILKNIANISPKIMPEDVVIIGIRDTEYEEDQIINQLGINTLKVSEVKDKGIQIAAKETLEYLESCDIIYVSFDVDSMDCNLVSRGTGTPVPNGFDELEITALLAELCRSPKLCCFEIAEINPLLDDKNNLMVETGLRILETVINTIDAKFKHEQ